MAKSTVSLIVDKGGCHIGLQTQGCRGSSDFAEIPEIPTSGYISGDVEGHKLGKS